MSRRAAATRLVIGLASALVALFMMRVAACAPLPVFSCASIAQAQTVYTITVSGAVDDHEFEAYQVFSGLLWTGTDLVPTLTRVAWGEGVDADRTERDFGDAAQKFGELFEGGASALDAFAQELVDGGYLNRGAAVRSVFNGDQGQCVIAGLQSGCYLVKDVDGSDVGKEGFSYAPYVLRVAGDVDIRCAAEPPTLVKKVQDARGGIDEHAWSVSANLTIPPADLMEDVDPSSSGTARSDGAVTGMDDRQTSDGTSSAEVAAEKDGLVAVRLVAHVPANLADYEAYELDFYDWLPQGMELAPGSGVRVSIAGEQIVQVDEDLHDDDSSQHGRLSPTQDQPAVSLEANDAAKTASPTSIQDGCAVAGVFVDLTGDYYDASDVADAPDAVSGASVDVERASGGRTLVVSIDDVRALGAHGGDEVTVEYLAQATAGDRMPMMDADGRIETVASGAIPDQTYAGMAYLRYANDPNAGGRGSLGVTAPRAASVVVHVATPAELAASAVHGEQDDGGSIRAAHVGRAAVIFSVAILTAGLIVGIATRKGTARD